MLASPLPSQHKIIPIQLQSPSPKWLQIALLHFGRLLSYAIAGGLVGSLGAAGLLFKPHLPVQSILFYVGNLSLIYLGLKCLGWTPGFSMFGKLGQLFQQHLLTPFSVMLSSIRLPRRYLWRGLLWGCLPCGLVYGVLPLAMVSGAAWSGAILMFCFGLGALPYLLFTQGLAQRFGQRRPPAWIAVSAAVILIALGLLGLILPNEHHNAGWWC